MTTSPIKVGLIFHSANSENLGVGALTMAEIEVLRRAGERRGKGAAIRTGLEHLATAGVALKSVSSPSILFWARTLSPSADGSMTKVPLARLTA